MELEDVLPAFERREFHHHLPVETARPQKRGVERVGAVGGGDDDYAFVGVESVHLDEHRVERLLVCVGAADRVNSCLISINFFIINMDFAYDN